MRLVIDLGAGATAVELAEFPPGATLADLVTNATGAPPVGVSSLWVDEGRYGVDTPLRDVPLMDGATIGLRRPKRPELLSGWVAVLSGGLASGTARHIPSSRPLVIGRSPSADIVVNSPSASWLHATVQVEGDGVRIIDTDSSNGVLVDGVRVDAPDDDPADGSPDVAASSAAGDQRRLPRLPVRRAKPAEAEAPPEPGVWTDQECVLTVGGSTISILRELRETSAPAPGSLHNISLAGTVPYNRPPRPGRPAPLAPLTPPARKQISDATRFNFISILAPLVLAFAMVLVMRDIRYALLSALSPVLGVATWFDQKHRVKQDKKDEEKRFSEAVTDFRGQLLDAAREQRRRLQEDVPAPGVVTRWAAIPTTRLWERRSESDDFLTLHAGTGPTPWQPALDSNGHKPETEVKDLLDGTKLTAAPIPLDLTNAGVVGIVGDREASLAVARSLLAQAAVHCGPADLTIAVFADQGRGGEWEWTTWLPHTRLLGDSGGDHWVSADRRRSEGFLRTLRDDVDHLGTPNLMLVIDSDVLTEGRDAPARLLLGHGRQRKGVVPREPETRVSGIVLATEEHFLPASCTAVIRVDDDAEATVTSPETRLTVDDVVVAGITLADAERCALDLAHFEDPELKVPGAALPGLVKLPTLLGPDSLTPAGVIAAWQGAKGYSTPVGIGETGTFSLDLVADGPHGLVGGTTGSGKSEFLRTLVAGLAARHDPTRLTFILVDFKGGAAFRTCEALPHTIGTISNLDEQLADRAIRALEAEMEYRQRMFAAAGEGVDNLDAYLATNPAEPMPRLLLVVDEFAMLAKEHPDVLSSLVSVGAVGRTLGVHMILATQRPAGVVNDDILANTNLRVALRVQSREDSVNVVEVPDAAAIGRAQRGRAFVKLGQNDITPVQTALISGPLETEEQVGMDLRPLVDGRPGPSTKPPAKKSKTTELDVLIQAIIDANAELGIPAPRPVWPEALGERVNLTGFPTGESTAPVTGGVEGQRIMVGLSDDPDNQRQIPAFWDLDDGNLLLLGIPGSGTTTTLASIALTAAQHWTPDELDILILDTGSRDLAPLEELPHTAAYVGSGPGAKEQQSRFIKYVRQEMERRRASAGPHRRTLVLVDGFATLRDENSEVEGQELLDAFYRAYADGPDVGLYFAVSTTRAKAVPSAMEEVTTQRWFFRLADPYDYSNAGIRGKMIPAPVPGRCVPSLTKQQTHVATPGIALPEAVAQLRGDLPRKRNVVGRLPDRVSVDEVWEATSLQHEPWVFPVGIADHDLSPAMEELYEGEHFLIAGPVRSGKSSLLLAIAEEMQRAARRDDLPLTVWGAGGRRSPLLDAGLEQVAAGSDELAPLIAQARMVDTPLVLLIDDAESFDDPGDGLKALIAENRPGLHIVAAGRADDLRSLYGHWTKEIRKSRAGVLIQPNIDYDGELLGVRIPRRAPVAITTGRGYACGLGMATLVHCIQPSGADR